MSKVFVISEIIAKDDNTIIQDYNTNSRTTTCVSSAVNIFENLLELSVDVSFIDTFNETIFDYKDIINDDDYVVIDSSLKKNTVSSALSDLKGTKVVYVNSSYNARKLKSLLDKIDILKINKLHIKALLKHNNNNEEITELVKCLNDEGVKEVLVTDETILYLGIINDKVYRYIFYDYYEEIKSTTIVSDALLAGYIFGKYSHLTINETIRFALSFSVLAIDSDNKLAKVNVEMIQNIIESRNNN